MYLYVAEKSSNFSEICKFPNTPSAICHITSLVDFLHITTSHFPWGKNGDCHFRTTMHTAIPNAPLCLDLGRIGPCATQDLMISKLWGYSCWDVILSLTSMSWIFALTLSQVFFLVLDFCLDIILSVLFMLNFELDIDLLSWILALTLSQVWILALTLTHCS